MRLAVRIGGSKQHVAGIGIDVGKISSIDLDIDVKKR